MRTVVGIRDVVGRAIDGGRSMREIRKGEREEKRIGGFSLLVSSCRERRREWEGLGAVIQVKEESGADGEDFQPDLMESKASSYNSGGNY